MLRVRCDLEKFKKLQSRAGVLLKSKFTWSDKEVRTAEIKLVEAVVALGSEIAGKTSKDLRFYEKFWRDRTGYQTPRKINAAKIADTKLSAGDAILLEIKTDSFNQLRQNPAFVIISEIEQPIYRKAKLIPALLIMMGG